MSEDPFLIAPMIEGFEESELLLQRLIAVLRALPEEVRRDFADDPRFRITKLHRRQGVHAPLLALPAADGRGSRCVVLKARLADCSESFGLYVIAHELAHAYLHNGSWGQISDREEAADALAASWGFVRPRSWLG